MLSINGKKKINIKGKISRAFHSIYAIYEYLECGTLISFDFTCLLVLFFVSFQINYSDYLKIHHFEICRLMKQLNVIAATLNFMCNFQLNSTLFFLDDGR